MGFGDQDDRGQDDRGQDDREQDNREQDDETARGQRDEEPLRGSPPDPLDRVWLHPSELPAPVRRPAPAALPAPGTRGRVLSGFVGGIVGTLVTVVALAATGAFDRTPDGRTGGPVVTTVAVAGAANAADAGRAVVAITARDNQGVRYGSGVGIGAKGEVLTSARLVGDATSVEVTTQDGEEYTARVRGQDRYTDLVLLTIDRGGDVPAATLAEGTPDAGTQVWVVAAAGPATPAKWMSEGILASTEAVVAVEQGPMSAGVIETDATTGTYAAGGALVDAKGAVVGIVMATNDPTVTHAIPVGTAVTVAQQLHASGSVPHGSAGITGTDGAQGPAVTEVAADGPGARAGLQAGDLIVAADGKPVPSMRTLEALLSSLAPGREISLQVRRGATTTQAVVVLGRAGG